MDNILVTGFAPFLSYSYNPSGAIAEKLDGTEMAGCRITGITLPVRHGDVGRVVDMVIKDSKPRAIIALALKNTISSIGLERIAINRYYFRDNKEEVDEPLSKTGQSAYFSTLPLDAIRVALHREGIPAEYSFYPDTYVSNELFYHIMESAGRLRIKRAGLVHLPITHKQLIEMDMHYAMREKAPSMSEDEMWKAVRIIIESAIND